MIQPRTGFRIAARACAELVADEVKIVVVVTVELVAAVVREPALADGVRRERLLGIALKTDAVFREAIDVAVVHDAYPRPLAFAEHDPRPCLRVLVAL